MVCTNDEAWCSRQNRAYDWLTINWWRGFPTSRLDDHRSMPDTSAGRNQETERGEPTAQRAWGLMGETIETDTCVLCMMKRRFEIPVISLDYCIFCRYSCAETRIEWNLQVIAEAFFESWWPMTLCDLLFALLECSMLLLGIPWRCDIWCSNIPLKLFESSHCHSLGSWSWVV